MNPTEPEAEQPAPTPVEPDDFKAMMIGATVIFVVAFIPFAGVLCCLPQILGALLALHLFTRQYQLTLAYGDGIKLGMLTVLIGGVSAWLISILLLMTVHYQVGQEIMKLMVDLYTKLGPQFAQVAQKMQEQMDKQKAEGVTTNMLLLGGCMQVIMSCISGLIGGALGTAFFKRGPKPQ